MARPRLTAMLYAARILAILWAGFWIWLIHTAAPGLFFALLLLLAWRRPAAGGFVLLAAGVAVLIAYPIMFARGPAQARNFVLLTMAAPPLLCGILLLWRAWLQRGASASV